MISRAMRKRVGVVLGQVLGEPETVVCISAPPSSSSVAISPVAALSSGGPARKILERPLTTTT